MAEILIIDDSPEVRSLIVTHVSKMGHHAAEADTLREGFEVLNYIAFDVVFLDVMLPDGNGLDRLPSIKQLESKPEVIIITGVGNMEGAELAINNGAWDYIQKPFTKQEIKLQLLRALDFRSMKTNTSKIILKRDRIIGSSPQLLDALNQVASCSASNANVLLTGETGTGKELFARSIHENSSRCDAPFVAVDCAALPDTLVESLLFGHRKGAFTGAESNRGGLIKQADGGTLFLDEIGEIPLQIQKSFLRLLQEREFRPVGSDTKIKSDFQLIAATNRNLDELVAKEQFREDLLFRIRTFHIHLPPLRTRPHDVKDLLQHYIFNLCEKHGMKIKGYVPEFLELMIQYHWPGNVRELINTMEKAILADPDSPTLYPVHLPMPIRVQHVQTKVVDKKISTSENDDSVKATKQYPDFTTYLADTPNLQDFRDRILLDSERQYLSNLMEITSHDISKAIQISGLSKSRLYTLLRQYGIASKK